ncbi:MAG TPA: energy transducer TonB [Pyrinomonadaceae bacterium]|jgi:TonB family protein|nr:energy transducer TonB [Pyrinomonadaceae bacterium]
MSKLTGSILLLLTLSLFCFSQTPKSVAPVKWERYSIPDQQATVLLPKLPVVKSTGNTCRGEKGNDYGAYADGAAYVLGVVNKVDPHNLCPNRKEFDEESFTGRVASLLKFLRGSVESDVEINGQKWKQIRGKNMVHMLYNDFDHKRWFEISIYSHDPEKIEAKDIFASLSFDQKLKGISIKSGSKTMLGDDQTEVKPVIVPAAPPVLPMLTPNPGDTGGLGPPPGGIGSSADSGGNALVKEDENNKGVLIAMKPPPQYTESARLKKVNGTVRLKVAMLNNGSIGEISVVSELPNGLTESSIAAARQILFVPAKKDKVAVSVTKVVEFHFSTF